MGCLHWPYAEYYTTCVRAAKPYVAVPELFCPSSSQSNHSRTVFQIRARSDDYLDVVQLDTYYVLFNEEHPEQSTLQLAQCHRLQSHYKSGHIYAGSRYPCDGRMAELWWDEIEVGGRFITISPSVGTLPEPGFSAPPIKFLKPARFDAQLAQPAGSVDNDDVFCPVSGNSWSRITLEIRRGHQNCTCTMFCNTERWSSPSRQRNVHAPLTLDVYSDVAVILSSHHRSFSHITRAWLKYYLEPRVEGCRL